MHTGRPDAAHNHADPGLPSTRSAPPTPPTAVTIGTFDGVHAGHAELIRRARAHVGPEGRVVVLSFDPHPASALPGRSAPPRLTTFAARARLLAEAGADEVRRLEPGPDLLSLTPEQFIGHVLSDFAPRVIVEGDDFRFGKGRAGTPEGLVALGNERGFAVEIVPEIDIELADQATIRASSTTVRWLLEQGRVADAARVLGRPHAIEGTVRRGDRLGRTLGFPTLNIDPETALPADGVYAALSRLPDGRRLPTALSIGVRPTVNDGLQRCTEAHLLGLPTSIDKDAAPTDWAPLHGLPEYGWPVAFEPIAWIREQVRFADLQALTDQIRRDCARARALLDTNIHEPTAPTLAPTLAPSHTETHA